MRFRNLPPGVGTGNTKLKFFSFLFIGRNLGKKQQTKPTKKTQFLKHVNTDILGVIMTTALQTEQ